MAEFLIVKCWPFYLSRVFTTVIVVVYVASDANAKATPTETIGGLHNAISELN